MRAFGLSAVRMGRDAMTATTAPDWDIASDAELAEAAANGDRVALAEIYDRYSNRLHDFCLCMVRDPDTAADCVHDTFYTAATRLSTLRDPSKLRPWLYAIARNAALRHIRDRSREQPSDDLPEVVSHEPEPDILATRAELSALVAQAAGGLSDRDRTVLELTYRHGLDGPELAEVLGVSAQSARTLTHRLRETIERSLGALLVARQARNAQECPELDTLLADWDGQFTILMRKRIARHIDSCSVCEERRRGLVNPVAMLGGAPLFIPAPDWLRESVLSDVQLTCAATALTDPQSSVQAITTAGVQDGKGAGLRSGHGVLKAVLLLVAAALAALGLAFLWPSSESAPLSPAGVTDPPSPTPAAPSAVPNPQLPGSNLPAAPAPKANVPTNSLPASQHQPTVGQVAPSGTEPITDGNTIPAAGSVPEAPLLENDTTVPPVAVPTTDTGPSTTPGWDSSESGSDSSGSSKPTEDAPDLPDKPSEPSRNPSGPSGSPDSSGPSKDSSESTPSPDRPPRSTNPPDSAGPG